MWRSLFIAFGIMAIIVGFESLIIESATFYSHRGSTPTEFFDPSSVPGQQTKTWQPTEWFPWLVLSAGALIVIYSFTLPKRFNASAE
ncbi:hypothetical protein FYK55_03820 [Roseiconus nitratireducens]|uniref:Uncharacterized protein n=1 Tax=Roseiconus nitratireducens TaxID=2605748 RepID=A0A5M6DEQ7_9BACT|nr:hypothetical protein [Roseiconus nitratireducens]KAA5546041.1 hypothetical protein FYK55_03820 [Roseiconus nitratireducens]